MTELDRSAWLEARRSGVGGSDVAAIAGLHPYRSAWAVYWDKTLAAEDNGAGEAARWGQLLEDAVAEEWAEGERCGLFRPGLVSDAAHPWRLGTPDRLAVRPGRTAVEVLEVKLANDDAWRAQWDGGSVVPAWYQAQGQWYAALTDSDCIVFAVLVGGRRLETFELARDDAAIGQLRAIADRFWHDNVLAGVPPVPDGNSRTREALDAFYPPPTDRLTVRLPPEAEELLAEHRNASREVKAWTEKRDEAGNRLIALLGAAGATDGYLASDDDDAAPAVTYRSVRGVDWAALEEEVGTTTLLAYSRLTYDAKAAEKGLGRKVLDAHRKPTESRRLNVRAADR